MEDRATSAEQTGAKSTATSCTKRTLSGHKGSVLCLDVLDSCVASGSEDSTVRIWDIRTGKAVRCITGFEQHSVTSVGFGKETSDHLFYASAGTKIFCFDLRRPEVILKESLRQYSWPGASSEEDNEINQITVSPNGTFLAACDDAAEIKVFHLQRETLFKTLRKHTNVCYSLRFRGRNKPWELFSGGLDSLLVQWDFSKGRPLHFHDMNTLEKREDNTQIVNPPFVFSLDISESGRLLAAGLGDGNVLLLDTLSNIPVCLLQEKTSLSVSQVRFPTFSPERHVLSGGDGDNIVLWDIGNIADKVKAQSETRGKGKNTRGGKKGDQKDSTSEQTFATDYSVVLRIAHRSKLNWLSTSTLSGNLIFVTDQTFDITIFDVAL